jgi:hypothetical protein
MTGFCGIARLSRRILASRNRLSTFRKHLIDEFDVSLRLLEITIAKDPC